MGLSGGFRSDRLLSGQLDITPVLVHCEERVSGRRTTRCNPAAGAVPGQAAPVASRPSATWGEIDMRRLLVPFLAVLVLAGAAAGIAAAVGADQNQNKKTFEYAIGLWGDLPYSDLQAQTGVPNLIADMNDQELQFIVHDGDLKAGTARPARSHRRRAARPSTIRR